MLDEKTMTVQIVTLVELKKLLNELEEELKKRGYANQFTITQCKVAEVPGQSPNYDLCVSTVNMDAKNCACPLVIATNLIINRMTEPIYNEIEEKLFKSE